MPLETTDYQRIEEIIDRAIKPLQASMGDLITRQEVDQRFLGASERFIRNERDIANNRDNVSEFVKWYLTEHEKLREATFTRIEEVKRDLEHRDDDQQAALDTLKSEQSKGRSDTIRYMVSIIVSFLIGGGLIGIIEFIRSFAK